MAGPADVIDGARPWISEDLPESLNQVATQWVRLKSTKGGLFHSAASRNPADGNTNAIRNFRWPENFGNNPRSDVTNAFKLYRRHAVDGLQPLLSHHFNLTVELPLKAIVRGYSYAVVPNDWINRKSGESKLLMREMGSRYLFIVLYCFVEKWLSKKDYHCETVVPATLPEDAPQAAKKLDA
jgi:hypothetical protein